MGIASRETTRSGS